MVDRMLHWVHTLFKLGQELSLDNTGTLRQKLLQHITDGFQAYSGSIALLDEDAQNLTLVAGTGSAANYIGSKIPAGQRILGWVAKHRQAVCLNGDIANDPRFAEMRLVSNPGHPVSALCWPLIVGNQAVGAISVNRARDQTQFTENDLTEGAALAGLISLVIDNTRTHDAYRQRIAELNAEKEQRAAAEARLTAVINSGDAILGADEQGRITLFNKAAETVFGYSAHEMLGEPVERLLPERLAANHAGHMRDFARSSESNRNMHGRRAILGRRKDGREFPVEAGIAKVSDGEKIMFTVTLRDISLRLQAEDGLQRLGRILDSTVNEIYVFDACTLKFTMVNQGAQRNLGYTMDELRHMTPLDLKPMYTREAFYILLMNLGGSTDHRTVFETVYRRKDGSLYPVEVRLQYSSDEAAPVYVAIVEDITELHKARELQSRLTAIIESTTDVVVTAAPDEAVLYLNQAGRRFMGLSGIELVNHLRISDFLDDAAMSQLREQGIPHAMREGYWHTESELRDPAGGIVPVSFVILAHKDADGRLLYISGIVRDMSERKKIEDELRARQREVERAYQELEQAQTQLLQSEKMASVGQLAAGVAHEINNPVGFVNSNLGTLQNYVANLFQIIAAYEQLEGKLASDALQPLHDLKNKLDLPYLREDTRNLINESIDGLGRVKKIVQDLKEFSHVDSTEWQIADLHQGLDSTLNIAHNELKYKVTVVKEYGELPQVECIASQINQVFMNMLVNAAHAIEIRGTITIRSGASNDGVWIEIKDTGKGMSPEVMKRIFEPFFTTKPVGKGTGLGLSLTYGIMQKHHGRIDVQSEVGKGACFRINLPVRQPEKQVAA